MKKAENIQFICTGNVCRSPMAEYLLCHRLRDREITVGSAGTAAWTGAPATPAAVNAMAEIGIDISAHRSRRLTAELAAEATMLLTMTPGHGREIESRFPEEKHKIRLVTSFGTSNEARPVGDPIGGYLEVYRRTREQLDSAVADLILFLREQGRLPQKKSP